MAGSISRMRAAAQTPSGPGGMRMSRNATANGSSAASASRTAATAASAPSQKKGANTRIARRELPHRLFSGGFGEEPVPQTAQHRGFAVHVGFDQDLPVRIAHLRLIVDDEYADYESLAVRHGCTSAVFMAIGVS